MMTQQINDLLSIIGPGKMPAVAYDTAWAARLNEIAPDIGNQALGWITEHQLPDGSWGAAEPFYYHDRVICTLAAMIALAQRGRRAGDKKMVERGLSALNKILSGATQGLAADPNGETIGFRMIVPTLIEDAHNLGLIENQRDRILGRMGDIRKLKQQKLRNRIDRYITPAFSAEMAGINFDILNIEELPESNGSIGDSPAATAYFALLVNPGDPKSLAYLRNNISNEGGLPFAAPFDIFEVGWVLWNLAVVDPAILKHPLAIQHVNFLKKVWHPKIGVGFAENYSVPDGDDSALVFDVFKQAGVDADVEALLSFEEEDHFRCYGLEANPSTSVNAHLLGAFFRAGMNIDAPPVKKIIQFLECSRNPSGFWFDKWHLSPYYTTSHIVIASSGYAPEFSKEAVKWIVETQNPDGSWGMNPTAEETAYCIQALWSWVRYQARTEFITSALRRAHVWLNDHMDPPYNPLWIGKCLYCPKNIIRSAILSALSCQV